MDGERTFNLLDYLVESDAVYVGSVHTDEKTGNPIVNMRTQIMKMHESEYVEFDQHKVDRSIVPLPSLHQGKIITEIDENVGIFGVKPMN